MEDTGVKTDSSPQSEGASPSQDLTKNLKAEMNRKFSKVEEKLNQLINSMGSKTIQSLPADEADEEITESSRLKTEIKAEAAREIHDQHFQEAKKTFPELDTESEDHDPKFFSEVDRVYSKFLKADPTDKNALKEAIEVVANRTGKSERISKEKFLNDEARRSRIIAEGTTSSRESKKEKEPQINEAMARRLGVDPEKLAKRLKSNKDKYGAR